MAQGIVKCELCVEDKDGTWFCKNCHQSLCEGCKIIHLRANISKHHDIISRKDMFQTQGESARHMDEYCKTHTKELYILFCETCECQVCRRCITSQHAQHSLIEIEEIFCEQREKGEKYVRELSQGERTGALYQDLEKKIKDEYSKIKAELDIAKNDMLKMAKDRCQAGEKARGEKESALTKLNRSLQGNKVSEILEANKLCQSIQSISDSASGVRWMFVPGTHSVEETSKLLGSLELCSQSEKIPTGFTVTYADLDTKTMRLRYNYPYRQPSSYPVAQLTGPKPFSETLKEFSIKILEEGEQRCIAIGIVLKDYEEKTQPGWRALSYGYHADDGGIYIEHGLALRQPCWKGDVMKCQFNVTTNTVTFSRNGSVVYTANAQPQHQYYPMVGLRSLGEEVLLLEKDPWSL